MAWPYPLTFDPQGVFLCMCSVSLVPKRGAEISKRILLLFLLAMTITLKGLKETKTGYLPCLYCYFHFGGGTGG